MPHQLLPKNGNTFKLLLIAVAAALLLECPAASADPPSPSEPSLASFQSRVDAIVRRELANNHAFEDQLLDRINAARVARGQQPFNRASVEAVVESRLRTMENNLPSSRACHARQYGEDFVNYAYSRAQRHVQLTRDLRLTASRWVREHWGFWDRFIRFWRGYNADEDIRPPRNGGNLGTDISLGLVDQAGTPEEQSAATGMRSPRVLPRDGIPTEDVDDPDNYPAGPGGILFVPHGIPLPTTPTLTPLPAPAPLPFELPVFAPGIVQRGNSGGCGCGSARVASVAGVSGGSVLSRFRNRVGDGDEVVSPPVDHGVEQVEPTIPSVPAEPSVPSVPAVPSRPAEPAVPSVPDGSNPVPSDLTGEFSDIGWRRFRLQKGGNQFSNCYRIAANTTRDGEIKRLSGWALISSVDRGRNWRLSVWNEISYKRKTQNNPLMTREMLEVNATLTTEGEFSRSGERSGEVSFSALDLGGQLTITNPAHTPRVQEIPLDSAGPRKEDQHVRILVRDNSFDLTAQDGEHTLHTSLQRN